MCQLNNKAIRSLISDTEFRCQYNYDTVHELRNYVYSVDYIYQDLLVVKSNDFN